jgi:hypothetical protein
MIHQNELSEIMVVKFNVVHRLTFYLLLFQDKKKEKEFELFIKLRDSFKIK